MTTYTLTVKMPSREQGNSESEDIHMSVNDCLHEAFETIRPLVESVILRRYENRVLICEETATIFNTDIA